MLWRCGKGHQPWLATYENIKRGRTWCPYCKPKYSKAEKDILAAIQRQHPDAVGNVRGLLKNKRFELDIWIPDLKIAIEYDGAYYHSRPDSQERDARKNKECVDSNIFLIRILDKNYQKDPEGTIQKVLNGIATKQRIAT
jgi:very-short-patch-repair endonuclease